MWPLLNASLGTDVIFKNKLTYLSLVNEIQNCNIEDSDTVKKMKELIQNQLKNKNTRVEGLLYFEAAVQKSVAFCPDNWESIIAASLGDQSYVCNEIACRIFCHIVKSSKFSPNKNAFGYCIPLVVPHLLNVNETNELLLSACKCLALCMSTLPDFMKAHKKDIEAFLLNQMDTLSDEIADSVAECLANLPAISKLRNNKVVPYIDLWMMYLSQVLNTMHTILNNLDFLDSVLSADAVKNPTFNIPLFAEDDFSSVMSYIRIFSCLCKCLKKLMSTEKKIQIPVYEVLDCIGRVFEVSKIKEKQPTLHSQVTIFAYPILQNAALLVLESLILKFDLHEESESLMYLIKKSIQVTKEKIFPNQSASQMRAMSWKAMNTWMKKFKSSVGNIESSLIEEVFEDIMIENVQHMRDSHHSLIESESEIPKNMEFACEEALKVLEKLISIHNPMLEKDLSEKITSAILNLTKVVQMHYHPCSSIPIPYQNVNCRKSLYDVLLSISLHTNAYNMKWLTKVINMFKVGLKDTNLTIAYNCQRSLSMCRFLIHQKKTPPTAILQKGLKKDNAEYMSMAWKKSWNGMPHESLKSPGSIQNSNSLLLMDNSHPYAPIENIDMHNNLMTPSNAYQSSQESLEQDGQCNGEAELMAHSEISEESMEEGEPIFFEIKNKHMLAAVSNMDTSVHTSADKTTDHSLEDDSSDVDDAHTAHGYSSVAAEESENSVDENSLADIENESGESANEKTHENGFDSSRESQHLQVVEEGECEEKKETGEGDDGEAESKNKLSEDDDEQPVKKQKLSHGASETKVQNERSSSPSVSDICNNISFDKQEDEPEKK